ncbi:MAG: bifunctional 3-phenylpropionate/cinnamic acid dioxygenase ferredoxin subunit [Dermatophilaceae bacterium]
MSESIKVAAIDEIPEGGATVVPGATNGTGEDITVFHCGGSFYALDDTCSHAQASLAEGWVEDGQVECPLHGAAFDLRTGEALCPPATRPVATHKVEVRDGQVWLCPDTPTDGP